MILWMAFAALSAVVIALLLRPLLGRAKSGAARLEYDLAVYREQLREVDLDVERGLLTAEEADAARTEVKRRMLAAAAGNDKAERARGGTSALAGALAIAVVVPLGGFGLYAILGSPDLPDQPYVERQAQRLDMPQPEAQRMIELVDKLAARLADDPNDQQGWMMLARSYLALGRHAEAVDAFRHLISLGVHDGTVFAGLGEAIVMSNHGEVTAEAAEAFAAALRALPGEASARYYLGEARLQQGDAKGAIAIWRDLEKDAPADAEWLDSVRARIAAAAERAAVDPSTIAPAPPDVGAPAPGAGSGGTDKAKIREMVDQLASRLKEEPDDAAGWSRLGRSYLMLNEIANAKAAYAKAQDLNPFDVNIKLGLAEVLLSEMPQDATRLPEQFVAVMRQVQTLAPDNADALYFVGLAEAQAGDAAKARTMWTRLRDQMPPDSPGRADLQKQIDALGG